MTDDRLATDLWLTAHLRRCSVEGVPVVVVHRGEAKGGTVMLKIFQPDAGCRVLAQMRDLDGRLGWYPAHKEDFIAEAEADGYIARAVGRDPDLWVVEVETRDGTHPFEDMDI